MNNNHNNNDDNNDNDNDNRKEFEALLRVRGPDFLGQFGGTYLEFGGSCVPMGK